MRSSKFAAIVFASFIAVSCSDNETPNIVDKTDTVEETPAEYPEATGAWIEARTFMIKQEDDQGCDQVDFRVMANSGVYSVNECDETKSGQLTVEEFKRLDRLTTKAYQQTDSAVCPEVFRFDKFYASIDASNNEFDRSFDPDSSCYRGSESAVNSYKNYLQQLLDKYRGDMSEE